MNTHTVMERVLWSATILVASMVTITLRRPSRGNIASPANAGTIGKSGVAIDADSIVQWADYVAENDPFRPGHRPATVPFGAPAALPSAPSPVSRPTLALRGIVGTSDGLSAIVGGVPGRDGDVLLRVGDTAGGLRVRRLGARSVVLQGADSVWTLLLKAPWQ